MFYIRSSIRLVILGCIFFIIFLNLITYINSVSSLRNRQSSFVSQKEQALIEKTGFESDILKQTRDQVNTKQNQKDLVRISPNEIKRPIDIQKDPITNSSNPNQNSNSDISIVGR